MDCHTETFVYLDLVHEHKNNLCCNWFFIYTISLYIFNMWMLKHHLLLSLQHTCDWPMATKIWSLDVRPACLRFYLGGFQLGLDWETVVYIGIYITCLLDVLVYTWGCQFIVKMLIFPSGVNHWHPWEAIVWYLWFSMYPSTTNMHHAAINPTQSSMKESNRWSSADKVLAECNLDLWHISGHLWLRLFVHEHYHGKTMKGIARPVHQDLLWDLLNSLRFQRHGTMSQPSEREWEMATTYAWLGKLTLVNLSPSMLTLPLKIWKWMLRFSDLWSRLWLNTSFGCLQLPTWLRR